MTTIPASELVSVVPSVLGVGGSALDVIGLLLSTSARVPIGTVRSFPDASSVGDYFGLSSTEADLADTYFNGFEGSNKKPASILFAQYNESAVAAFLRGAAFGMTVAEMQALSGSLTIVIDGYTHVISSISLAAYSSFSAAAAAIETAFTNPTEATFTASIGSSFTGTGTGTSLVVTSVTGFISVGDIISGTGVPVGTTIVSQASGTTGGAGTYVTSVATTASSAAITATSTVLHVTAVASGTLSPGQTLDCSGTDVLITAQITGTTGAIGNYRIAGSAQSVASETMTGKATMPDVTYDSVTGAFQVASGITGTPSTIAFATGTLAASLALTSATGAVLSQGAAAASPGTFMDGIVDVTTDWVTFMTTFDPDGGSGNTLKQEFAEWTNDQNNRYGYVCSDTDITATQTVPATNSLGYILEQNESSGTCLIYDPNGFGLAAFICGAAASIDFEETNGRITFAYKSQSGITASVTSASIANSLGGSPQTSNHGNGYNFYGAYASANDSFVWFQRGFVTGSFAWFDSYINQIWLNNAFQLALLVLMGNVKSIPYTTAGYALIEAALADVIIAGLNFGAFGAGNISQAQIAEVNQAAGANVAPTLQTQGWYLQIKPASSSARAARTSPPCTFWYLDRGSVQSINLASVALQ